jgi:hypothetical protein
MYFYLLSWISLAIQLVAITLAIGNKTFTTSTTTTTTTTNTI